MAKALTLALAFVLARAGGVQESPAPKAATSIRNLVVVTLDTTRADHLGCYGYFRDTTPQLDALAAQSVRFTRCYSPIAHTTPSHASLFTSVYPYEHGVLSNSFHRSSTEQAAFALRTGPTLSTLAQAMQRRGLKTGAFVSAAPVKEITGIAAGFDAWSEPVDERRIGAATIAEALRWLDSIGDAPFFLWVHLFDAHGPVQPPRNPPRAYLERYRSDDAQQAWLSERHAGGPAQGRVAVTPAEANNLYDGQLRFLDDQLAVLLKRLDAPALRDSTLLVAVGDHGHGLGQHGFMSHGTAYAEQLCVPLLLRAPGLAPRVDDRVVSTLDVVPTALALAPALRDEALLAQCRGVDALASDPAERPLIGMSPPQFGLLTLFTTQWKLILKNRSPALLFDVASDPFELEDVAARHQDVVKRIEGVLRHEIDEQRKRARVHHPEGDVETALSPEIERQLRALGYDAGDDVH